MRFELLASGSKGNCCIVQDENTTIVIDCGSTKRYLKACFEERELSLDEIDAVLITHEHTDHISQVKLFAGIPMYSPVPLSVETLPVKPGKPFHIEHITVYPLALSHDAPHTVGYILETWKEKLVYITDTGYVKDAYLEKMKDADYIVLESNHDIGMLMKTMRPSYVKARIKSDSGHLCNEASAQILEEIIGPKTKRIVLAHISQEANTRELALQTTMEMLESYQGNLNPKLSISAAGQFEPVKGGWEDEENSLGTCYCVMRMERMAHH
ncbi:MAG: MBL fold metallo-hydrolase [Solobacterium sp.]|nr:MBL fold metallo-hydrolase [Solobacterium sp.]